MDGLAVLEGCHLAEIHSNSRTSTAVSGSILLSNGLLTLWKVKKIGKKKSKFTFCKVMRFED